VSGAFEILALDLAERATGYCIGAVGSLPRPRLIEPRKAGDSIEDAAERLARWTRDLIEGHPGLKLIVIEQYLTAAAASAISGSLAREGQIALHYAVRAVAACYHIPVRAPFPSTVRTHFCGRKSAAAPRKRGEKRNKQQVAWDRAATKAMVVKRAQQLGYLTAQCQDPDLADAAALWDFAAATFGSPVYDKAAE
jgi:hypothetical protein